MKIEKSVFWLFLVFVLVSFSYAIGVYNTNGDFVYYVNNTNPTVKINISSPAEALNVSYAMLKVNGNLTRYNVSQPQMNIGETKEFDFDLKKNFSIYDNIFFKLYAFDMQGAKIVPKGDPTNFFIKVDTLKPQLLSPDVNKDIVISPSTSHIITFSFDDVLSSYELDLNGNAVYVENTHFPSITSYNKNFVLDFDKVKLKEGINSFVLKVKDLAGNENIFSFNVKYRGPDIKVKLLTKAQDPSLKYYYNSSYAGFFNKTIYSSENNFSLKIKTTKAANCFFTENLMSFKKFNDFPQDSMTKMSSGDGGFTHTVQVSSLPYLSGESKKIWVACKNKVFDDDIGYLSDGMGIGKHLITIKKYTGSKLAITSFFPQTEVTNLPFDAEVNTNQKAVCQFSLDNKNYQQFLSQDYLEHNFHNIDSTNGNHIFDVTCFDVLGNSVKQSSKFNINTTKGVKVVSYSPKYSSFSSLNVNVLLSEDAICKYSSNIESPASFDSLQNLTGSGYSRTLMVSLSPGKNTVYVYCEKGSITKNTLEFYYDPNGPQLSNLTFVNKGIHSDYIGSTNQIGVHFDVKSLIPVEKYFVNISSGNSSQTQVITSNTAILKGNFSGATSISVFAQNMAGKNGSVIEKNIEFDLTEPTLNIVNEMGNIRIACFDSQSGCSQILYGFSMTSLQCRASIVYGTNSTLKAENNNYICAEGYDNVGHKGFTLKDLSETSGNLLSQGNLSLNESSFNTSSENATNVSSANYTGESTGNNEPFVQQNFNNTSGSGVSPMLIAAIFLLIAGVGSGGFYAYKKGYLNDQLGKLGIIKKGSHTGLDNSQRTKTQFATGKNIGKSVDNKNLKKGSYNEHLKKLNSFIDDTLDKRKDVFDTFKTVNKGKVENYDDTLIKSKNKKPKEDFDEFYPSSKEDSSTVKDIKNTEKEAEEFEEFYKKKKEKK